MSDKTIELAKVQTAPRGSKKDWAPVSGQVPPHDHARLMNLVTRWRKPRTEIVAIAIQRLLDQEAA